MPYSIRLVTAPCGKEVFRVGTDVSLLYFWLPYAACRTLAPQSGMEPVSLALEAWSLNHWTAREVPAKHIFDKGLAFRTYIK